MHEKYVALKKSYSEQEMVGIKNALLLFCVNDSVSQDLDPVISTEHAPKIKQLT